MAQKLLSGKLFKTLHIALFLLPVLLGYQVNAQSVLLPGDVVIVSASADTQSIDFIPLIDIREGTSLYFSNGVWDDSLQYLDGNELQVIFNKSIAAGTNIHIDHVEDERFSINGEIEFTGGTHRLFSYQKEAGIYRFIFGLGWGKGNIWNTTAGDRSASDIPQSLKESSHTLLTLGEDSNYQYFVRNGASGTRDLLLKFVGDAAHWRGNNSKPFPAFGTSFNFLSPPVILFDRSVSTVQESDSVATLNIAIYEHDGSRLSVDVVFDSLRSITSSTDFKGFNSTQVNFTGLIGDGVYEVNIPIQEDSEYEGRETGIFILKNLTGGNFGDFLSHSLVVLDNEKPDVLISKVMNSSGQSGYIEVQNMEKGVVSLNNWILKGKDQSFIFPDTAILYPGQTLKWIDQTTNGKQVADNVIFSNLKKPLLEEKGGLLTLQDYKGEVVSQVTYSRHQKAAKDEDARLEELFAQNLAEEAGLQEGSSSEISAIQTSDPGYKMLIFRDGLTEKFEDKDLLIWNESGQSFNTVTSGSIENNSGFVLGYFTESELDKLEEWNTASLQKKAVRDELILNISATDKNENEVIDGLEGLNLVYNNLDIVVPVKQLKRTIQENANELAIAPVIYAIRQSSRGELNFMKMSDEEEIAANAPFWIMLEQPLQAEQIRIEKGTLIASTENSKEQEIQSKEEGKLKLTLRNGDFEEQVGLTISENTLNAPVHSLNSYPELFLPRQRFLSASFHQGEDYFKELTLSPEMAQVLTLPLEFSTTESGPLTFAVTAWEGIPDDWTLTLRDLTAEKEYKLREDFSIDFEHTVGTFEDSKKLTLDDFKVRDRFVILVTPPSASVADKEEVADMPRELELHQNFPNPFNPVTTISFYLPEAEEVRLSVFNIVGQPVAVLVEGTLSAGEQQFEWDATDKPSGMYIYQLEVGKSVMTRKMTLVK